MATSAKKNNGCIPYGVTIIFGIFLLGVLIAGVFFIRDNVDLARNGITAEATVVGLEISESIQNDEDMPNYNEKVYHTHLIAEFQVADTVLRATTISAFENPPAQIGEKVEIVYLPNLPEFADLSDQIEENIIMGIICTLIGTAGMICMFFLIRYFRRNPYN
ncbi:MAG: DUF3592 domain-containing protein [Crocinitomicaceae bacterium]|nr:DUF3592 domain-containing protein [Crocinitomicaceae bacterium]